MSIKIKSGDIVDGKLVNFKNGGSLTYSPKTNIAYINSPTAHENFIFVHNVSASSVARFFKLACNQELSTRVLDCGQIEFTRKWDFEVMPE